jgi:carbonic anhydrase
MPPCAGCRRVSRSRRRDRSNAGRAPESFTDLDADVRQSVGRIRDDPFIPVKDSVRGFVYDVETGTLREVE